MTLDKLIYDVREALRQYSDDSEIDNRYIVYLYNIKRSKFLKQDINNNLTKPIDHSILQSFCEEVENVDKESCQIYTNCSSIMRTKNPIPSPLDLHSKSAIIRIGSLNVNTKPFNIISRSKASYLADSTFNKAIYTFLHTDGHLYFTSYSKTIALLEKVEITGVFENPLDLEKYKACETCDNTSYEYMTSDYPIQNHYIDIIKNEIVKDLVQLLQIPEDKINNGTD